MMVLWQEARGVLEIRPHLTQIHPGRMWPTLIWTQTQGTASLAQTRMKWPYEPPRRSTRRGYKLPVGSTKAASGLRLNWKGSVTAARPCGDMTMRVFKQSGIVLLQKTTTPLRCAGWWSGLTNCSALPQPPTPKFTPETWRLRGWGPWPGKDPGIVTETVLGLQGLHLSDAFRCSNISSSVGLKSFCPWCFRLGGNTEMIATHLREVHYWVAITCDLCKSFASMSAQSVLEQCSGCKAKYMKEHAEQEGWEVKKSHKKKLKVWEHEKTS